MVGLALFAAAALAAAQGTENGAEPPAMVILVRHAERAAEPHEDPPLTDAGRERARALVKALADAGVTAIVTSDRRRTRETAEPIARELGLRPTAIGRPESGLEGHVLAVASEVRRHPGGVVLVVGHTDTLPSIVRALGGPAIGEVTDGEFGNLFVMTRGAEGWRLVRGRYGAPDRRP